MTMKPRGACLRLLAIILALTALQGGAPNGWAGTTSGTDPKGDPIQPVGVTISRSVCPPTESGYGSLEGSALIQVRVGPAQRFGLGYWSQLYGCGGISATMTLDQPDRAEFFLGSDRPHGSGNLYVDPLCEIPQSNHIISWPRQRTIAHDPNMPDGFVQHWVSNYNPLPTWPSDLDALAAWASAAHLYHFDWGQLRPDPELDTMLTEKPYLNVPEPTSDTIFLYRADQFVETDDGALSDCRGFFPGWNGRGDRLLTRLRPGRFTRPGFTPPASNPDQAPPIDIRMSNLNPWDESVMADLPAFFEPPSAGVSASDSHVSSAPDDRSIVQVTLNPQYEPRRASYSMIGAGFGFPLVAGKLHTIHADICVWDREAKTCFKKPEGNEIPTYLIPPPEDGWLSLSATWWGKLTLEEQGAQTGGATGKEMPHPKGVLTSMRDGDELKHLQQRLTWKLITPTNRSDQLMIDEPVMGYTPFQRVIPFARLVDIAGGDEFEVELAVNGGDGERLVIDKIKILIKEPLLIPNYDRDQDIDRDDQKRVLQHEPFYFWINDDDDSSAMKISWRDDLPDNPDMDDWESFFVDSVRDLVDFFPVHVNIRETLTHFPATAYEYLLKQEDSALNFVDPLMLQCLGPARVDRYLKDPDCANHLENTLTGPILSDGFTLPDEFLEAIQQNNERVLLLEGRRATDKPLVIEIRRKAAPQDVVLIAELPLSIDGVEQMFRHKNFRTRPVEIEDRYTAPNWPNDDGTNLVYIHGFKVDEQMTRASATELFKRLWQSGYNGKFWYIAWHGNPPIQHYHNAAVNAFAHARRVAEFLGTLDGSVDVLVHSLGNLLTSVAIADHHAPVRNYYALDAAVALEAYGTTTDNGQINGLPLPMFEHLPGMLSNERFKDDTTIPTDWDSWSDYPEEVYAAEWHRLFQAPDQRRKLTWRNRLRLDQRDVTVYNFYSSTEDVLGVSTDPDGLLTMVQGAVQGNLKFYVWQVQELLKGIDLGILNNIGGGSDPYAGWGFVRKDESPATSHIERIAYGSIVDFVQTTPEKAKARLASPEKEAFLTVLKTDPLFRQSPAILFTEAGSAFVTGTVEAYKAHLNYHAEEAAAVQVRDWLLAKAFPARTGPLGSRENPAKEWDGKNFNMNTKEFMTNPDKNVWPRIHYGQPVWWHTDFEDMPYLHVWQLYDKWVKLSKPEGSQ